MDKDNLDKTGSKLTTSDIKLWLPPSVSRDQEKLERLRRKAKKSTSSWSGFYGKTLWDWLQFLGVIAIPFVVAAGTLFYTLQQTQLSILASEKQHQTDIEIADNQQQESILQNYLDRMSDLLLNYKLLGSKPGDAIREVARARTITVLDKLDSTRKGDVINFLYGSSLIYRTLYSSTSSLNSPDIAYSYPIVDLYYANLSGSDLSRSILEGVDFSFTDLGNSNLKLADLQDSNLYVADLSGANLLGAKLNGAYMYSDNLSGANMQIAQLECLSVDNCVDLRTAILLRADLLGAHLSGADLAGANLSDARLALAHLECSPVSSAVNISKCTDLRTAILLRADLLGAYLNGADLAGANLSGATLALADLRGAILQGADLSNANLYEAKVTTSQLAQAKSLKGAIMPDGSKHS